MLKAGIEAMQKWVTPGTLTDPEATKLTYSLGGVDAGLFEIDASTGQISTGTATTLDHESPADSNGDNVYEWAVQVMDGEDREGNIDTSTDDEVGPVNPFVWTQAGTLLGQLN